MTEDAQGKSKKDEAFWKVLSSAIELDYKKGHLKWTITELSRKSKVTRSLIYYYFGRSKLSILKEGVKVIGEELVGLNERRVRMWKEGRFMDSVMESWELCQKQPYLCSFYLNYRTMPNEIGESLLYLEKEFFSKVKAFLPTLNDAQIRAVYSTYFGIIFCPISTPESLDYNVKYLEKVFSEFSPYVSPKLES